MADRKDKICVDQDRLIEDVRSFSGQTRIMSVAARGLARPLLDQMQSARRLEVLRSEARYGKTDPRARRRQQKAEAAIELREGFEEAFVAELAEPPNPSETQSGLYGTVTRSGVPQPDLLVGLVTEKGTWRGYGCTDQYGAYSFTFTAGRAGTLRVQEKSGAPLYRDPEALPALAAGQTLRRDVELDASGPICPAPGPIDDGNDDPQPVTVEVPDLIGRTEDAAIALLREARLNRGSRTQTPSDAEEGTVIDQTPPAGRRLAPGSTVDIVVAEARQQLMPKVTDIPLSLARATLERAGLTQVTEVEEETPDAAGIVLAQDPQPDMPITPETPVTLTVGVKTETIMPRLIGEKTETAREILAELGVEDVALQERIRPNAVGLVVDQSPRAGAAIDAATSVVLTVGIGAEGDAEVMEMPRLVGETEDTGRDILREMGLRQIRVEERTDRERSGLVIDQRPEAGSPIRASTRVVIVVGRADEQEETEVDPEAVLEIMAADPLMRRRQLSPERLARIMAPNGRLTGDLLVSLSRLTIPEFAARLEIGNRAMATEILRALRTALDRI